MKYWPTVTCALLLALIWSGGCASQERRAVDSPTPGEEPAPYDDVTQPPMKDDPTGRMGCNQRRPAFDAFLTGLFIIDSAGDLLAYIDVSALVPGGIPLPTGRRIDLRYPLKVDMRERTSRTNPPPAEHRFIYHPDVAPSLASPWISFSNNGVPILEMRLGWIYLTGSLPTVISEPATISAVGTDFVVSKYDGGGDQNVFYFAKSNTGKPANEKLCLRTNSATAEMTVVKEYRTIDSSGTIGNTYPIPTTDANMNALFERINRFATVAGLPTVSPTP